MPAPIGLLTLIMLNKPATLAATLSAAGALCEIFQRNPDGARTLIALAVIALAAFALHVAAELIR